VRTAEALTARILAGFLALALLLPLNTTRAQLGAAEPVGWRELAAHPERYVGRPIEIAAAYCSGGASQPLFQCSTAGSVYIEVKAIGPASARQKVDAECGGIDVVERSPFCRARIRFTPRGFHIATDLEPKQRITVFETDSAELIFTKSP
jgi:hypothetical protein